MELEITIELFSQLTCTVLLMHSYAKDISAGSE